MGACGCITSSNTNQKNKRSKSVDNKQDGKLKGEELQKISESIMKGEAVLKKVVITTEDDPEDKPRTKTVIETNGQAVAKE